MLVGRLASRGQGQVLGRLDYTKLPERLVGPPGMPSDADAVYYAWKESPGGPLRYAMFGSVRCCMSPQAPWMLLFRSQPSKMCP